MSRKILISNKTGIGVVDLRIIRNHFSAVKIVWGKDRFGRRTPVGFKISGVTYDLNQLNYFVLCVAILGVTAAKIKGVDKVEIPIEHVWELCEYVSKTFVGDDSVLWGKFALIIKRAFELLGYDADITTHDGLIIIGDRLTAIDGYDGSHYKQKRISFNLNGVDHEDFFRILNFTMYCSISHVP